MNCVYSNDYFRKAYERVSDNVVKKHHTTGAVAAINQGNILMLAKTDTSSGFKFDPAANKSKSHELERLLEQKDDFVAYGIEYGFVVIPVVEGVEVVGKASPIISFGDPAFFTAAKAPDYETAFNAGLRVITGNVTRMDNFPTGNFRYVPQYQLIKDVEIAVRKVKDSMFQVEPFLSFEGNASHLLEVSFTKTADNLNQIAGFNIYAAINLHGFLIEDVNKR